MVITIFLSFTSCEDKTSDKTIINTNTHFNIEEQNFDARSSILYTTDYGNIITLIGDNFELCFILTDSTTSNFSFTDTLFSSDSAKAKCVAFYNGEYFFSNSGSIFFNPNTSEEGTFSIEFEGLSVTNGIIIIDSIVNNPIIDFTKIKSTSDLGNTIYDHSSNDWEISNYWELCERSLFNLKIETMLESEISVYEYPNPFKDIIQLDIKKPENYNIDLLLVNKNYEIEYSINNISAKNLALDFSANKIKPDYYRLYYRIHNQGNQYFGSGDLKKE